MLAGLLFAIHDAEDRADRLAAALPFAGTTLIEYQARLMIAAGAAQLIVVVAKLTPDVLGALNRISRRGVAVDVVRNGAEAVAKLHPLARLLVFADGLVTTEELARAFAVDGDDALLVLDEIEADRSFERVGGGLSWAGVARLQQARLREVAAMPRDYDLESALIRAASQAGAAHLMLPANAKAEGHGIEHGATALEARGRAILSSVVSAKRGWFDRWITAPVTRLALPRLVTRGIPTPAVAAGGMVAGVAGMAALYLDQLGAGLLCALTAVILSGLGYTLASLRDERRLARWQAIAELALPAFAMLLLGWRVTLGSLEATAFTLGVGAVTAAGLAERASDGWRRGLLWGSPGAYLVPPLLGAAVGWPTIGLAAAAIYAATTLGLAIERLRRRA